ncbi:MAG: Rv2231c family pyridoxal phosphate-dependent protein CobC [Gordonia sp. (in: high G+C Gram-positive bacteria)]
MGNTGPGIDLHALDRHGDLDAEPGLVDFAVNVRGAPPPFLADALTAAIGDLAAYPGTGHTDRAIDAIAALHGRHRADVLLLAGAADGFEMLPRLGVAHAALIQPSFTEPEIALRAAGIAITQVVLTPPWQLDADTIAARIPDDADLVILGNPTNPTSVLHPRAAIEAMRRPGRLIVIDEAFADLTIDASTGIREPESMAGPDITSATHPDVIVIRSITKTFGLAGLRAGYLLAAPPIVARLTAGRRPWPLSTLALIALAECAGASGQQYCEHLARRVVDERAAMIGLLADAGVTVLGNPAAPFLLISERSGLLVKERLRANGFAVRSAANFVGLGDDHLRLAVRPAAQVAALIEVLAQARKEVADGNG